MCDCELPTVYGETIRKARKPYACSSCDSEIPAKSKYFDVRGLWDDSWDNYKVCETCHAIAAKFARETGDCAPIVGLIDELHNCDIIENQSDCDDPLWVSNVSWIEIKNQNPLQLQYVQTSQN